MAAGTVGAPDSSLWIVLCFAPLSPRAIAMFFKSVGRKEVYWQQECRGMLVLLFCFLGRLELQVGSRKNARVQEGIEPGAAEAIGNQVTAVYYFPALSPPSQEASAT